MRVVYIFSSTSSKMIFPKMSTCSIKCLLYFLPCFILFMRKKRLEVVTGVSGEF